MPPSDDDLATERRARLIVSLQEALAGLPHPLGESAATALADAALADARRIVVITREALSINKWFVLERTQQGTFVVHGAYDTIGPAEAAAEQDLRMRGRGTRDVVVVHRHLTVTTSGS